jgi:hypothetical protein
MFPKALGKGFGPMNREYIKDGRGHLIDSSKYTGAILRKLRAMRGVGRPPEVNLARGGAMALTPWRGPSFRHHSFDRAERRRAEKLARKDERRLPVRKRIRREASGA